MDNKGYITQEEFATLLQSDQLAVYLSHEDMLQMQQYFQNVPNQKATYTDFYPLGKEIILRLYRARDTSDVRHLSTHNIRLLCLQSVV